MGLRLRLVGEGHGDVLLHLDNVARSDLVGALVSKDELRRRPARRLTIPMSSYSIFDGTLTLWCRQPRLGGVSVWERFEATAWARSKFRRLRGKEFPYSSTPQSAAPRWGPSEPPNRRTPQVVDKSTR